MKYAADTHEVAESHEPQNMATSLPIKYVAWHTAEIYSPSGNGGARGKRWAATDLLFLTNPS
jgi:hypothetical protein